MARVDVHAPYLALDSELDDAEIMAAAAPPPRLPSVHPLAVLVIFVGDEHRRRVVEETRLVGEEIVGGENGCRSEPRGGEIDGIDRKFGKFGFGGTFHVNVQ